MSPINISHSNNCNLAQDLLYFLYLNIDAAFSKLCSSPSFAK